MIILILGKKTGGKYHIYYLDVIVDKIMLKFVNNEVNKRLKQVIVDTNCVFPRLEGFNKWIWTDKPKRNPNGNGYSHYGSGYFAPNSYYEPVDKNISIRHMYKSIYKFNSECSVVIKPISTQIKQKLTPTITIGKAIDFSHILNYSLIE